MQKKKLFLSLSLSRYKVITFRPSPQKITMMKKNVPVISPPCLKKNAQNSHRPALQHYLKMIITGAGLLAALLRWSQVWLLALKITVAEIPLILIPPLRPTMEATSLRPTMAATSLRPTIAATSLRPTMAAMMM